MCRAGSWLCRPCHEVTSAGLQGGYGFNRSLCQHSSALPTAWWAPPPTPPGMTTPGEMLAGREDTVGVMRETLHGQICKNSTMPSPLGGLEASTAPY